MTERSTFDPFELRLAAELERYVASATDPKPAADIAKVAMQPRGLGVRVRNASGRRRTLLLAFAAALLVPAVYLGTGGMRQPAPDQAVVVRPDPNVALTTAVPILIRRMEGSDPGLSIFAVRPDGMEVLIRTLSDSIVGGPGALTGYGRVSSSGWLEVSATRGDQSWPVVLVDLRDPASTPWVIDEADDGGISPAWGPDGTLAALQHDGNGNLVIVDPEARSVRTLVMGEGLVGGGPSIIWTRDGSGIFGADDSGHGDIVPIQGFGHRPATDPVFDPRGTYGTGLATLRLCAVGSGECGADDDGRVQRVEDGGSAATITVWEQRTGERALAAAFGNTSEDYWLAVDQDQGRKVALIHLRDGREERVAVFDRGIGWSDVGAPVAAPDQSVVVAFVYQDPMEAGVVVPLDGSAPSFHLGHLAGFIDRAAAAAIGRGSAATPPGPMPLAGRLYELPSVDQLVAAELAFSPGHRVLFSASRDATDGDTSTRTIPLTPNQPGSGDAHLVCFGPASATVSSGSYQVTNQCLRSGGVQFQLIPDAPLTIETTGDTTWRLVVYND